MKRRALLSLFLISPAVAHGHSLKLGDMAIGHAWALPTQQSDGQVFMPLVNNGVRDDALVAARCDIAALVEFRANNRYDDPPLKEFALTSGKPLPMRPTARHLRLVGLEKPLDKGDRFSIILDFLNAGEISVEVHVEQTPGN